MANLPRHAALLVLLALLLAGCGSVVQPPATTHGGTSLLIVVHPHGSKGRGYTFQLRCDPPGGTHPQAAKACEALSALARPFAPTPPDTPCTELYGGLQTAEIRGTYLGSSVRVSFDRVNGCEVARWDRLAVLFQLSY